MKIYDVDEGKTINQNKFKEICPSLIQQLESGACAKTNAPNPANNATTAKHHEEESWKRKQTISIIFFSKIRLISTSLMISKSENMAMLIDSVILIII